VAYGLAVEAVGAPESGSTTRPLGQPAKAGHPLTRQHLLHLDVAGVDIAIARVASWMGRRRTERPDSGTPAVQPELVGNAVEDRRLPEVAEEPLVRPEDHRPQRREQPVPVRVVR